MSEDARLLGAAFEDDEQGVAFVGPFVDPYRITVDGYRVPQLTAYLTPGTEDYWTLCCDERFMIGASGGEAKRWLWFVAQCMAVAAGFSCHGERSRVSNPYQVRMHQVTSAETEARNDDRCMDGGV